MNRDKPAELVPECSSRGAGSQASSPRRRGTSTFNMFYLKSLFITTLICISLSACTDSGTVLGKRPIHNFQLLEVHSDILTRWAQDGVRDAVVVNIDAHDDIRAIAEPKLKMLRELIQKKDWQGVARANTLADTGLYNVGNFLFAGARLGIVREVYWIIPFPLFKEKDPVPMLQYMLRFSRFSEDDIATFSLKNGCFSGKYKSIPLTICGIENLPDIGKPVILSIDIDFFPEYARTYSSTLTEGVRSFFSALFIKGYRVSDAVISYSISGGFLKPKHRWVGDLVEEALQRPDMVSSGVPERFKVLQKIDTDIRRSAFSQALERINSAVKYLEYPAFKLYRAEALFGNGQVDAALSPALDACQKDKAYCYELPHLGMALAEQGRARDAVRFFSLGYEENSSMDYGQAEYGIALAAIGRNKDALAAFEENRAFQGSFPIDFMITATYIRTGETAQALDTLRRALARMDPTENVNVVTRPLAEAIATIAGFCRANGYAQELAALENSSLTAVHRKAFPSIIKRKFNTKGD